METLFKFLLSSINFCTTQQYVVNTTTTSVSAFYPTSGIDALYKEIGYT